MIPSMQQKAAEPQLVGPYLVAHISIPRDWSHVPHFPVGSHMGTRPQLPSTGGMPLLAVQADLCPELALMEELSL